MSMPTKQERLDSYRMGVTVGARMARDAMTKAGDKANAILCAMIAVNHIDSRDAKAVADLINPLAGHFSTALVERDRYFASLEASQLSDEELRREHDARHPEHAIGRLH